MECFIGHLYKDNPSFTGPTKVASLQKELQSLKSNYTTMNIKVCVRNEQLSTNFCIVPFQ